MQTSGFPEGLACLRCRQLRTTSAVGIFWHGVRVNPGTRRDVADCTQPSGMSRVIAGCTGLLAARERPAPYLALVYRNRSAAYAAMGNFERAEQDHHQAIALNPDYKKTYKTRTEIPIRSAPSS